MSDKIANIFEEVKEALKGKNLHECAPEFKARFDVVVEQAVKILAEELPEEIKNLDENDQKKLDWFDETYKIQVSDRLTEAVDWLEKYYNDYRE